MEGTPELATAVNTLVGFLIEHSDVTFALLIVSTFGGVMTPLCLVAWWLSNRGQPTPMAHQTSALLKRFGIGVLFFFFVWVLFAANLLVFGTEPLSPDTLGKFGDSFGVLTSLFTGLGFAGLYVTLRLQSQAFDQQSTAAAAQTFFQLLAFRSAVIERLEANNQRGYALIHRYFGDLVSAICNTAPDSPDYHVRAKAFFTANEANLSPLISATQVLIDFLERLDAKQVRERDDMRRQFCGFLDPKELVLLLVYFDNVDPSDEVMRAIGQSFARLPIESACELPSAASLSGFAIMRIKLLGHKPS